MNILDSIVRNGRTYYVADTEIGKILFYKFGKKPKYAQYKNITNKDFFWNIVEEEEFERMFEQPFEFITTKRLKGLKILHKFKADGNSFQFLYNPKEPQYIYKVDSTLMRAFTKKKYPDMKFLYEKFNLNVLKHLAFMDVERMYYEKIAKWNGNWSFSVHSATVTIEELFKVMENMKCQV